MVATVEVSNLIESAVERDRENLRRRLHDGVLQLLEYMAAGGYGRLTSEQDYRSVADRAARELRTEVEDSADAPRHLDLVGGLRGIVAEIRDRAPDIIVHLHFDEWAEHVCGNVADALVQAAREALNNVIKHSRASRVIVSCSREFDGAFVVHIFDNGIGATPRQLTSGTGVQRSIISRMQGVGGDAVLNGYPGHGTSVRLELDRTTTLRLEVAG